jgi:hypothetical protein
LTGDLDGDADLEDVAFMKPPAGCD